MKPANYAPAYCAMYPALAEITRKHGYALAVHGSMARDFDLICIPWVDNPSPTADVISDITSNLSLKVIGKSPETREHGRECWTLLNGFGECFLDFSFMPKHAPNYAAQSHEFEIGGDWPETNITKIHSVTLYEDGSVASTSVTDKMIAVADQAMMNMVVGGAGRLDTLRAGLEAALAVAPQPTEPTVIMTKTQMLALIPSAPTYGADDTKWIKAFNDGEQNIRNEMAATINQLFGNKK